MRILASVLVALLFAALQPRLAFADVLSDKQAAATLLAEQADLYATKALEIADDLTSEDRYVVYYDTMLVGKAVGTITKEQVDALVGYLQVESAMNRGVLDDKKIAQAVKALDIDLFIADFLLQDRATLVAKGGAAAAHDKLRKQAEALRPEIEAYAEELYAEAKKKYAQAEEVAGLSSWPPTGPAENVFSPVEVGGVTVDYCLSFATDCGMPVADEFCRLQGFKKARGFDWQYMKPTKTLRSGETCDADYCGGFTSITCE